jgi:uncharacterized protein (DUF1800 family)
MQPTPVAAAAVPGDSRAIVHVLNRLGFGPRSGDIERVRAIGVQAYIEQQLHPERVPDAAMASRLEGFLTIGMSSREIAERYALPVMEARRRQQQNAGQSGAAQPAMPNREAQQAAARVMAELSGQKMLRAVYSERQLQEVLTDFWFNHFNVDARKGQTRFMLTEYERDAIRPHVLGRFRDLLEATAKSPAMLFYLDNWMSADPDGPHVEQQPGPRRLGRRGLPPPPMPRPAAQQGMRRGLNENYGRELMELHTLGVDGGYTQKDVTEVARAFTGWTIQNPRLGGGYVFDPRIHDPGRKVVLGHEIKAGGGESDGERVLDILAAHPSTARFIATKLARRFVSDTPPQTLVDRLASTFRETDGDLRRVMQTLFASPEFFAPEAYRAKVKTPFEFVVSAVRATGTDFQGAMPLVRAVQQLGMPLYMCQPPTGYQDTADAWVNTGALVNRMNFALQLAGNGERQGPRGASFRSSPASGLLTSPASIIETVLDNDVSDTTRETIARATTTEQMTALTLGSPEFQRR